MTQILPSPNEFLGEVYRALDLEVVAVSSMLAELPRTSGSTKRPGPRQASG